MVSITTIIVLSGIINYANSVSNSPTTSYPTLTPTSEDLYDCLKTCFLHSNSKLFG